MNSAFKALKIIVGIIFALGAFSNLTMVSSGADVPMYLGLMLVQLLIAFFLLKSALVQRGKRTEKDDS